MGLILLGEVSNDKLAMLTKSGPAQLGIDWKVGAASEYRPLRFCDLGQDQPALGDALTDPGCSARAGTAHRAVASAASTFTRCRSDPAPRRRPEAPRWRGQRGDSFKSTCLLTAPSISTTRQTAATGVDRHDTGGMRDDHADSAEDLCRRGAWNSPSLWSLPTSFLP